MTRPAIVMNMFYTGLGIARSLAEQGISVIGLTAHRGAYGNFTRYAKVLSWPDTRQQPEAALAFLLQLGDTLAEGGILFPTRDDDVLFLDRFRVELSRRFVLVLPEETALTACLNKWETYRCAEAAGVAVPRCWSVTSSEDLHRILPELTFPCVLKPISAHHWRKGNNWKTVGNRKAIGIFTAEDLLAEYETIARADSRALLQELIPGGDDCLWIAACYLNRHSNLIAGFTIQKLLQVPEGFGTGCILQTVDRPDLLATATALLQKIQFTGIAEVEFKWDAHSGQYKLIEINPRPWDQHRLGKACGVDLIHIAYCDLLGITLPDIGKQRIGQKWIAEDVFSLRLLQFLWRRDGRFWSLLKMARGQRICAVWSIRDPLPLIAFIGTRLGPELVRHFYRHLRSLLARFIKGQVRAQERSAL